MNAKAYAACQPCPSSNLWSILKVNILSYQGVQAWQSDNAAFPAGRKGSIDWLASQHVDNDPFFSL